MKTLNVRFWSKVKKRGPSDCWNWTASLGTGGYGQIGIGGSKGCPVGAHRAAWMLSTGKRIPKKKVIMHTCDNKLCCNPAHLKLATQAQNIADMIAKGRNRIGKMPKGEEVKISKLTDAKVRKIRHLYNTTMIGQVAIAKKFGVGQSAISAILRGATWKHVA